MSWIDWRSIEIVSSESHFNNANSNVRDRMRIVLDMPMDTYRKLRQQIEAPESVKNRRKEDPKEDLHGDRKPH